MNAPYAATPPPGAQATALVGARWARGPQFSSDGRALTVTSNLDGTARRWAVDLDHGRWPRPFVNGRGGIAEGAGSPGADRAVVTRDPTGAGRTQLYLAGGEPGADLLLTAGYPLAIHTFQGWSGDGEAFYFAANRRRHDRFDLYRQRADGVPARRVWTNDAPGYLASVEEAPGRRRALVRRMANNVAFGLAEVDVEAGTARALLAGGPPARYLSPAYAPDGESVYVVTDRGAERHYLARVDLGADALVPVLHPHGDAEALAVSPDGGRLAYVVNVEGYSRLRVLDLGTGAAQAAPLDDEAGVIRDPTFAPDGRRVAFGLTRPDRPSDVFLWDLETGACRAVTEAAAATDGVVPGRVAYETFDGRQVPAFLYRPPGAAGRPVPAVVYLHGGPEAQFRPEFDPLVQLLVARGFAVLAPNVRGSTGYGTAYHHLDDRGLRRGAIRDVAHAARWLQEQDGVDGDRLAVCGASYGGYLTLAALAEHPGLWAAGASIAGISSLVTLLQRMTPESRAYRAAEYGRLDEDYDALLDLSPLTHARHVTAPTLLVHGAQDVKVPIDEARQMAALLRTHGVPVETSFFEGEGHVFSRPATEARAWAAVADFFQRHLAQPEPTPDPGTPTEPFARADLHSLAARAATLDERLAGAVRLGSAPEADTAARWKAWREAAAGGDPDRFAQRLAWDGLDEAAARHLLGTPTWPEGRPLPEWAETVADAVERFESAGGAEDVSAAERPFEVVAAPFVAVARERWARAAGPSQHLLGAGALDAFDRQLRATLTAWVTPTLTLKWRLAVRRSGGGAFGEPPAPARRPALYRRFLADLRAGGLAGVLRAYPVLARHLGTAVDLWVEARVEFAERLAADWRAIEDRFQPDAPLGTVAEVRLGISDRHNGGRGVVVCTFASGLRLVYKPRTVALEGAYNGLLRWVNARGELPPLRTLRVLDRATHGWVEYAAVEPCPDEAAAARYYRRMGALLGVLYGFHGTDCHWENVVACGEHPVVVDAEMLAVPALREPSPKRPHVRLAEAVKTETVLEAGFLPQWTPAPDGAPSDASALLAGHPAYAVADGGAAPAPALRYTPRAPHLPRLHGLPVDAHDHADEVAAGFDASYRFLQRHRDALAAPAGPLDDLARREVRVLFRDTSLYARVLRAALAPRHLRDGMAEAVHLEQMARGYRTPDGARPFNWPMLAAERQALAARDVPYFSTGADRTDLALPTGEAVPACFLESSADRVRRRLASLCDADRVRQLGVLRGAFAAHRLGYGGELGVPPSEPGPLESADGQGEDELIGEAARIAHALAEAAVPLPGLGRAWLAADRLRPHEHRRFGPAGYGLAAGHAGLALFFGAVADVADDGACRAAAYDALAPVREAVGHPEVDLARALGLGAGDGVGGIVYALARLSRSLDDPDLLADARRAAALVTPERIAADVGLDVLGGSAGALLGLLALAEVSGDEAAVEGAQACARHLLRTRRQAPTGHRVWETVTPGRLLTGMSHGAAGIAYALLRLHAHTGDPGLVDAAREAIAFERTVYDADAANWPDFRADAQPSFWTTWCHGAPGIGLARLGGLASWQDPAVRDEIDAALATTLGEDRPSTDHLCCGAFGRLELPTEAARLLDRPALLARARRRAAALVASARRSGGYRLTGVGVGCPVPSLFYGEAGIGYQLLRLARPDALPSVLRFE